MNYKVYYYENENICVISELLEEKPELEELITNASNLKINLNEKNVENIFSFFKENTIKQILSPDPQVIEIDYSEISELPFFKEENFKKLKNLIDESANKCNKTINDYIENTLNKHVTND